MKQRKVRADFDKSQPIAVNVDGCSEEVKKKVIQAFFDVGLTWGLGDLELSPTGNNVRSYTNLLDWKTIDRNLMWSCDAKGITPAKFFSAVYEDEPKGHPHADLMAHFAEDAKTHPRPWELWQYQLTNRSGWEDCDVPPRWIDSTQYRRKLKTHTVNGVEIPDLRIKPNDGDLYFHPDPANPNFFQVDSFDTTMTLDLHNLKYNLCYEHTEAGKQAAILHAKSMLGIV